MSTSSAIFYRFVKTARESSFVSDSFTVFLTLWEAAKAKTEKGRISAEVAIWEKPSDIVNAKETVVRGLRYDLNYLVATAKQNIGTSRPIDLMKHFGYVFLKHCEKHEQENEHEVGVEHVDELDGDEGREKRDEEQKEKVEKERKERDGKETVSYTDYERIRHKSSEDDSVLRTKIAVEENETT